MTFEELARRLEGFRTDLELVLVGEWDNTRFEYCRCSRPIKELETFHLVLRDESGMICDVKEQDVRIFPAEMDIDPTRLKNYLEGWCEAVKEVLERTTDKEFFMPSDFSCEQVLKLSTVNTVEEFKAACLVKSRLGKFCR